MTEGVAVRDLSFTYTGHTADMIFRNVSFAVEPGKIFCLLGPNGTGKSTLLKCVSNVFSTPPGKVFLFGEDIAALRPADVAKEIGYVPQSQVSVFPFLVKDVVIMGRAPHLGMLSSPTRKDVDIAYRVMKTVGILSLAERPCTALSGGEWQLTLIARALAQGPRILVLDEPTSHLDMGNQMRILRTVKDLAEEGLAVVMASHFPDHAFLTAGEAAILNHGRIVHKGPPDEVITDANMKEAYGIETKVLYVGEGVNRMACFPSLGSVAPSSDRCEVPKDIPAG